MILQFAFVDALLLKKLKSNYHTNLFRFWFNCLDCSGIDIIEKLSVLNTVCNR